MEIFLNYARQQSDVAKEIYAALSARGREVFFDQDTLQAGLEYTKLIENVLTECKLFIALLSPDSVKDQKYALTEVGIARKNWRNPSGRVLPVMVVPTLLNEVDAWLRAVTILYPQGNIAAEVAMAADRLLQPGKGKEATVELEPTLSADLLGPRIASYRELWQLTSLLPKWPRAEHVRYEDLLSFSESLRDWYFGQGGGMFLSRQAHTAYSALQDSLSAILNANSSGAIDDQHYDAVRELCSAVRSSLARDIGTRK